MTKTLHLAWLFVLAMLLPQAVMADQLMNETFSYPAGDLYGQGGWCQYASNSADPIQVGTTPLSFAGYQSIGAGGSVALGNTSIGQDLFYQFRENGNPINSGTLYCSFLVNVSDAQGEVYFFALVSGSKNGLKDKGSTSEYLRIFAKASENEGKFLLGASKNGATMQSNVELNLNETYLVVLKWEFVEGTTNDVASVYVNPVSETAEPTLTTTTGNGEPNSSNGLLALELRQGTTTSKTGPTLTIDDIRVATSWAELFSVSEPPAVEDGVEVTEEKLFNGDYANVGETVPFARYTVEAHGLASAGSVYLTGANAAMFEVDKAEVPAGDGTTVITVSYKPTAAGKHSARLNFELTPVEWNQGFTLNAVALDPAAMPSAVIDRSALTAFSAAVGESQSQTFTVTTTNLVDYGTIRFTNPTGAFLLSTSSLLKNGENTITLTFNPKQEGSFNETIAVEAIGMETQTFNVSGMTTAGKDPEDKEGDAFELTTQNPLALMIEGFDNAVKNKPLALEAWTNSALAGTRAWWGYTETNDAEGTVNGMAKVTPYDSFGTLEGEPCEMMLVTPPLALAAAAEKLLSFRIKGQYLADGQTDLMEVCYIDATGEYVYTEPINGLDIPATADANDQWRDYTIDLTGLELADPFHIGFHFKSMRGKSNSATYYVDDVSWGRADLPFIRPAVPSAELTATLTEPAQATFHITGLNLTAPIALRVTGPNASKFALSENQLPKEGGDVTLTFTPEEEGLHEAYIEMTSEGAPASQIIVLGHAVMPVGIHSAAGEGETVNVTTLEGIRCNANNLKKGVYIVTKKDHNGKLTTQKVVVK